MKIADYQFVERIKKDGNWISRLWPVCAKCGGPLQILTINLPRHAARELLEQGLLDGEAERLFHSTRDDLGWSVRGKGCSRCKRFEPQSLHHAD